MHYAALVERGLPAVGGAMTRVMLAMCGVWIGGALVSGQVAVDRNTIERPFAEGGCVELRLASGDYTLRAGDTGRIVVRWSADDAAHVKDLRKMSVDVHVDGRNARVLTNGPTNHVHFTIEMPARSDVFLRVKAGDIDTVKRGIDRHVITVFHAVGEVCSLSVDHDDVHFGMWDTEGFDHVLD